MCGHRWMAIGVLAFAMVTGPGCQGFGNHRASAEPSLSGALEPDGTVLEGSRPVIGVPVGIFGEVKQIVVGAPPEVR
jgi:hypothetical protein